MDPGVYVFVDRKAFSGIFVLKSELLLCKIKIPCEKEIAVLLLFYKEEKCRHLLQNIGRGSNEC